MLSITILLVSAIPVVGVLVSVALNSVHVE